MDVKSVLLLLLVVVTTSLAQKKCCFPDQYEAIDGQIIGTVESGKGVAIIETIQFASDYTNKRVGELVVIQDQAQISMFHLIIDYKAGVEYIIHEKTKTCQKVPLQEVNMPHCVPADASYSGSFYVGDKKVTVDSFNYDVKQGPVVGTVILSVSRGDCIPFSASFIGTQGETSVLSFGGFVNYTSGIKDPSKYFTVPDYCPKSFSREPKLYKSFLYKIFA